MFGTLGNLLVCLAVITYPRLRRPSNYLLFSLAIADLIVTMACEPLVVAIFIKRTFFNDCAPDLELPYVILSMLSCSTSVAHMAAISIDRFIAVVFPLQHRALVDTFELKVMLITCWAYPILVPILSAIVPPTFSKDLFALLMFAISYGIVFLSYSLIVIFLVRHKRQEKQLGMRRNSSASHESRVEIRVASTLGIVTLVFTVCWLPFVVVLYATGRLLVKKHGVAYMWIRTLALSNSAINFLIYGSRMKNFHDAFAATGRKILGAFTRKCSRTQVFNVNDSN